MAPSKYLLLIVGLAVVAALAWGLDLRSRPPASRSSTAQPDRFVSAPGRIEGAREASQLRFASVGRVVEVLVREGQFVQAGDLLARIDPQQHLGQYERAQADLSAAAGKLRLLFDGAPQPQRRQAEAHYQARLAELVQAESLLKRVEELRTGEVVTQQELEAHRAQFQVAHANTAAAKAQLDLLNAPPRDEDVQIAKAQVDAARANAELARTALEETRLMAPLAGQVLRTGVRSGEMTGPAATQPAIVLADTRLLRVRAFVDEFDAPRVAGGMEARITADVLRGRVLPARVVQVSPAIAPKQMWTGQPGERYDSDVREVWLDVEQSEALVIGLRVDVLIDTASPRRSDTPQGAPAAHTATSPTPEKGDHLRR